MINKKISKVLGPMLGIMGFMLTIGVLEATVLADDNVQADSAYTVSTTAAAVTYKDYSINVNKSAEQNGVKVTIDKVTGTKHKIKVIVKVENETAFDQKKLDNLIEQVTYGENNSNGGGTSYDYLDDKTLLLTIEQDSDEQEYPEKGDLRFDLVIPTYKVNIGMDVSVDFSESFKNTLEKDLSVKIPKFDFTLNKLESNSLGTTINYSKIEKNYSNNHDDLRQLHQSSIILKTGDKMYKTNHSGSSSTENEENDIITTGTYESELATYERLKDQKDMSIIPVVCNISSDEINKIYKSNSKSESTEKTNANKETTNNINYVKSFEFSDGSKGEIYNIERNDNSVKVYCKGNSEKESLLMASNMDMHYTFLEGNANLYNYYDSSKYMCFYKDSKDATALGYVVEFDNVEKDKAVDLDFDSLIKEIDKYTIGDEIQLSK